MNIARKVRDVVLPEGSRYRRLPFGLAAGCVVSIDFRHQTRMYLGLYERELVPHFRALVRPGDRCFDVGGQGGYDALMLAKLSRGAPVVSFECNPEAVTSMRETFARNPYGIRIIEAFVGSSSEPGFTTLDDAAERTFAPDFIKMDIEGAEADALEGARTILREHGPALIIEVHGKEVESRCIEILSAHGYTPRIVDQSGWWAETRPLDHNRWLVCDRPRRS
jgi:hypothetical protein